MAIIEATKPEVMAELKGSPDAPQAPAAAPLDELSTRLNKYYEGAARNQERRHPDWTETYTLYRDRVITNRLVQRQSVNVPLMKETIRTILSDTDEPTDIYFESLSGDKQKEIFLNEYWKDTLDKDNFETKDTVDKKQEYLYGISTIKLNLFDGRATFEVLEPQDVVFDRFADPSDIDGTAMYLCHRNIYRSISALSANPSYNAEAITSLRTTYATAMGLVKAEQTFNEAQERADRLQQLGLPDVNNPAVGETFVEVREHYMKRWDDTAKKLRIVLRVTAGSGNEHILLEGFLDEILGINFFPFVKWSDDVERTDMYPDGAGDVARTPNKTLNAFFSQMVENRTLRNFGMTYYDSTKGDGKWIPQTYTAEPFGWYPVAGNPNDVTKRVEVANLGESMNEMNFIIGMVERATAASATEKGVAAAGKQTLGEIQLLNANTQKRIKAIPKFYNRARKQLGEKWYALVEANADKLTAVELYKKSAKGNMFKETVAPSDWKDAVGFRCKVTTTGERNSKNNEEVAKLTAIQMQFPNNVPLKRILQKKALDMVEGLSAEEIQEVLDFEKQAAANPVAPLNPDGTPATPATPALPSPHAPAPVMPVLG